MVEKAKRFDECVYCEIQCVQIMYQKAIFAVAFLWLTLSSLTAQCVVTDELRTAAGIFVCGESVSYQGYDYATVLIGEQCWFAENLRNENYENGDAIPTGLSDGDWSSTTSGATAVYDESASNLATYGRLYNWFAVNDSRGLCPSGWHVPTDGEWTVMTGVLGETAGIQLKTTSGWPSGGNGTNSSGFSALPGGYRNSGSGNFLNVGYAGNWWSSSSDGSNAWRRLLFGNDGTVYRYSSNQRSGYSVRCVQD